MLIQLHLQVEVEGEVEFSHSSVVSEARQVKNISHLSQIRKAICQKLTGRHDFRSGDACLCVENALLSVKLFLQTISLLLKLT